MPSTAAGTPDVTRPVLVTGAAGFAGSHLLDLLAREDHPIVAWSRRGTPGSATGGGRCTWRAVDVTAPADVDRAIGEFRPRLIYHCAADAESNRDATQVGTTLAVNVRGTQHVLDAVRRHASDARVIVTGSALVYKPSSEPLTEDAVIAPAGGYAFSKLAQETLALRAAWHDGLDVIVARAFNHIGPRQSPAFVAASVAQQIARIEVGRGEARLLVGNLEARRDLADVRDTVRAYRALADRGLAGTAYNVCRGEASTIRTLVEGLVARSRVPVEIVVDPARLRPVDVPVLVGSHDRITAATGWRPEIPLDQTLDDLLSWWRQIER
jgi:GDP-4-dehydro-6-deoxy-D-mannose reductase